MYVTLEVSRAPRAPPLPLACTPHVIFIKTRKTTWRTFNFNGERGGGNGPQPVTREVALACLWSTGTLGGVLVWRDRVSVKWEDGSHGEHTVSVWSQIFLR